MDRVTVGTILLWLMDIHYQSKWFLELRNVVSAYQLCRLSFSECPEYLRVNRNDQIVACMSPCNQWNYPAPYGQDKSKWEQPGLMYCCPLPVEVDDCRSGPVVKTEYVRKVRSACPTAYSYYSYDDVDGLHDCPRGTSFDVTICP